MRISAAASLAAIAFAASMAAAQSPTAPTPVAPAAATPPATAAAPPPYATTKVSDNVYVFRYGGHQAMFVVTPAGVIATDPIAYQRPQAAQIYLGEIRKVTQAPIRYLVYSHHHYDHIAGGKPFKDAGALVVAHKNARTRLDALKYPEVVLPDMIVDERSTLEVGGTRVDLIYVGRNHSDNSLVMLLPKEKILFAVDFIPVQAVMSRDMPDGYLPDWFDSLDRVLALDWTTMIPGHPGPGGRMGTKEDVRALKEYLSDLSAATKELANQGKCFDEAIKTLKLPKYEAWAGYAGFLPGNIERFCEYWGRGI
jgi:glyoxylase-like metal-dependent hydrolase (beta-lactamase superfamily II)